MQTYPYLWAMICCSSLTLTFSKNLCFTFLPEPVRLRARFSYGTKNTVDSHFTGTDTAQEPPALSYLHQPSKYIFHMHSILTLDRMEQILQKSPGKKFISWGNWWADIFLRTEKKSWPLLSNCCWNEKSYISLCVCVHVCDPILGSYQLVAAGRGEFSV